MGVGVSFGTQYAKTRFADVRISERLLGLLGLSPGSVVADIGAGTGNYSRSLADRSLLVKAIEPSLLMLSQASPHENVHYISAVAENLPFCDGSADGVISVLALHHYEKAAKAIREMKRIVEDGPIVLFTVDHRLSETVWISKYFPSVWEYALGMILPLNEQIKMLSEITRKTVHVETFRLPYDFKDLFLGAAWKNPATYTEGFMFVNTTPFLRAASHEIEAGTSLLKRDILSGKWNDDFGYLANRMELDLGHRFIKA